MLLKELILESMIFEKRKNFVFIIFNFLRWNLRNRFQKTRTIDRWACLMISAQKPNQNQLSIAKQFVDQFPYVKF